MLAVHILLYFLSYTCLKMFKHWGKDVLKFSQVSGIRGDASSLILVVFFIFKILDAIQLAN